ncbi:MAG: POTRA domain-containing protein, partial [Brevundimonas sp.]
MNDMNSRAAVRLGARSSLLALVVAAGLSAPALAQTEPATAAPGAPQAAPAGEQPPRVEIAAPQSLTVNRILVQGAQRIDQTTVLSYLPIRPGDTVDASVLDVAVRTLSRTGLFADVQLGVQNGDLIVQIVENPIINQVVFEGNSALSQDKLTKE